LRLEFGERGKILLESINFASFGADIDPKTAYTKSRRKIRLELRQKSE